MTSFKTRKRGGYGTTGAGGEGPDQPVPVAPMSRFVQLAGAATSVALLLGVVVWGYKLAVRDVSGVPIIRALEGPARIAPEDPGGDLAAHVGLAVNEVAGTGLAAPGPERVVLAPEPESLAPEDAPMAALRPLPNPQPRAPVAPVTAPSVAPVPDTAQPVAPAATPLPENADGVAAAEGEVPLAETAPAAEAAPEAAPEAPAADAPIASTTGVLRSPRPLARPEHRDLEAEAAARAVAEAMGGGAAPSSVEIDAASLPEGTRVVQLGAFDSAEIARAEWDKIALRFEPLMAGKKRIVQEAASGGRSFWRLRVQGFETVEDARRFCAALVAEGANCIPTLAK